MLLLFYDGVWESGVGREDWAAARCGGQREKKKLSSRPLSGPQIINKSSTTIINTARDLRLIKSIRFCSAVSP